MAKFDPDAFGKEMARVVRTAIDERMKEFEKRIGALEAHRVKALEDEVQRLRGTGK